MRENIFVVDDAELVHEVNVNESCKIGVSDSWLAKCKALGDLNVIFQEHHGGEMG